MRPRCPTCGAGFRGGPECSRCGADLRKLSAVLLAAHGAREAARRALLEGDRPAALTHARRSLELENGPRGRRLLVLAHLAAGQLRTAIELLAAEV